MKTLEERFKNKLDQNQADLNTLKEEIEQKQADIIEIKEELEQKQADLDYLAVMTEVDLSV